MNNDENKSALSPDDPYNEMETAEKNVRPGFLNTNARAGVKDANKKASEAALRAVEMAAGILPRQSTSGIAGGLLKDSPVKGLYTGSGGKEERKGGKGKFKKFSIAFVILLLVMIIPVMLLLSNLPPVLIYLIDMNLQNLGITQINATMQAQSTYISQNALKEGKVPQPFASDLASNGIEVGQINLAGEFVRTDVYLANLDGDLSVASVDDNYSKNSENGELVVRFKDQIIKADSFVATLESNPEMYAAYSKALNINAKFHYSEEVEKVYQDLGISRSSAEDWERTGDRKKDQENYNDLVMRELGGNLAVSVNGYKGGGQASSGDNVDFGFADSSDADLTAAAQNSAGITLAVAKDDEQSLVAQNSNNYSGDVRNCSNGGVAEGADGFTVNVDCDMQNVINQVGSHTTGEQSTAKAAQLLSVALSATEPIKSAKAFSFVEGILQRTRIFGVNRPVNLVALSDVKNGVVDSFATVGGTIQDEHGYGGAPISELMNSSLGKNYTFAYRDVTTGEEVTTHESILGNDNFSAAISMGSYNMKEAQNFQRDRVLLATSSANKSVINSTTLATNGYKKSNAVLAASGGGSADMDTLSLATDSMLIAFSSDSSEWLSGVIGANRIVGGAAYVPSIIGQRTLGMMPSDAEAIQAYNREVDKVLALDAEAERATRSPFDITSKNTFLGSIVYNLATSMLVNYKSSTDSFTLSSVFGPVTHMADYSGKNLLNTVVADGPKDGYLNVVGQNCATSNSVSIEGDLYCNQHNTATTKYMSYSDSQWKEVISEDDKKRFALLAMNSQTPVGVKDGEVCELYKKEFQRDDDNAAQQIIHGLSDLLSRMVGLYESCSGVSDGISLRSDYTISNANSNKQKTELLSGFALYDMTKSLIYGTRSEMAMIRDEYYAKYPQDNSLEAKLARISGLSKEEVEIAMNYADYLTVIADYNPTTRYVFGKNLINIPQEVEFVDDGEVKSSTYLAWFGRFEYSDVRNRSFVV